VNVNGRPIKMLLDSAGSADMLSHNSARVCGLYKFPKVEVFNTTDSRGSLTLQSYRGVPIQVSGLPPIFTKMYECIDNGIYSDVIDGLTTELFTHNGYIVTITENEVLFERMGYWEYSY